MVDHIERPNRILESTLFEHKSAKIGHIYLAHACSIASSCVCYPVFTLVTLKKQFSFARKKNRRITFTIANVQLPRYNSQAKQAECCHLLECMDVLKSQEAQRDSQSGADIRQLRQQMAATEEHYKSEVRKALCLCLVSH